MALIYNDRVVERTYSVICNSREVQKIIYNDTLVWEKQSTPDVPPTPEVEWMTCPDCDGNGGYECNACDKGDCPICYGNGTTPAKTCPYCQGGACWNCNGSGQEYSRCEACYGDGLMRCGKCGARGWYYGCNACGTELYQKQGRWYCGKCGNFRDVGVIEIMCPHCDGLGVYTSEPCLNCGGTGQQASRCPVCNGMGGPCTYCNGNFYIAAGTCPNCSGTGYCPECDLGVVWCGRCSGTGLIEKPQSTYDGNSGDVTIPIGDWGSINILLTDTNPDTWAFSGDSDLHVVTYNGDSQPQHWGYGEITPSAIGGMGLILLYDFDVYAKYDGNEFPWGDGYMEGEFIWHFGTQLGRLIATLTYDETNRLWHIL